MKPSMITLAALLVLILLIPATLQAQMAIKQPMFRTDIPFAFAAGGVHLPAGYYHVYHPGDPYLIVIEKDDGTARAMAYVHPSDVTVDDVTKLVFNKYGDQYFLAEVWHGPDRQVHQCFKCQREKALVAQGQKLQTVVVAVKR